MPSTIINGIYFDGQSAKPQTVVIELFANLLRFGNESIYLALEEQEVLIEDLEDIDFSSAHKIQLKFGDFPPKTLVIEDVTSVDTFKHYYPQFSEASIYNQVLKGNIAKVLGFSVVLLTGIVFLYMNVIAPVIATTAVNLVPKVAEIKLGEKMSEPLFASLDIDTAKSAELNLFFKKVGFKSEYPVELFVCEDKVVNAFAIPGGKIVVYQGILDAFETWEELAAVLGHELAHVEKRHSLKQMSRNLSTYLVFSIMTSDASGVTAVFLENAFTLKDMSNSRSMETEADDIGFQYLKDLSVNPQGMVDLFKALQVESPELGENMEKLTKIMSTHPLTQDRIDHAEALIASLPVKEYEDRPALAAIFESLQSKDETVLDNPSADEVDKQRPAEDAETKEMVTN